jgi:hypothetical protein
MDVLPAQASAVPCEHVFSSSKETCSQRRNWALPKIDGSAPDAEISYKQGRLSFTDNFLAQEKDYTITGPVTPCTIAELVRAGRLQEVR